MNAFSTAATGGRKKRGEGHTRREEILQAAKELFLEQGYEATTIRRIADRVGVSAPPLTSTPTSPGTESKPMAEAT